MHFCITLVYHYPPIPLISIFNTIMMIKFVTLHSETSGWIEFFEANSKLGLV